MRLIEPQGYQKLTKRQRISCTNGCGPLFVQNNKAIQFLFKTEFFKPSCRIHDFQYEHEKILPSENHRRQADLLFLKNMKIQCSSIKGLVKRFFRRQQARIYFQLTRIFGARFYNYKKRGF